MYRKVAQIVWRSQISLPQSPPSLTSHVTMVHGSKQRHLTWVHHNEVNSRLYLDFTSFPINVLFLLCGYPIECPPIGVCLMSF